MNFIKSKKKIYNIEDIDEVIKGLDEVNENMKKTRKTPDIKDMYCEKELGDR